MKPIGLSLNFLKKKRWWLLSSFLLIVVVLALNFWVGVDLTATSPRDQRWLGADKFGSMFGLSSALFTGLSIIGIIYAIYQQDQQLRLAHREVKTAQDTLKVAIEDANKTKEILSEQQEHLKLQNEATQLQMFENTFFKMLDFQIQLTESIDLVSNGNVTKGKDAILSILRRFVRNVDKIELASTQDKKGYLLTKYAKFYDSQRGNISHYFRFLYNIFKYIDNSLCESKYTYSDIVRSILSDQEVIILFYNSSLLDEGKKFKKYVEKFSLLKHLKADCDFYADLVDEFSKQALNEDGYREN